MRYQWLGICLLALGLLGIPGAALTDDDHLEARRLMEEGAIQPLEEILVKIREEFPGRVLEVEMEFEDEGYLYEIELLDNSGQVLELEVDAVTGEIIKIERED